MNRGMVIAGDFKNYDVIYSNNKIYLMDAIKKVQVSKTTIKNYSVISDIANSKWNSLIDSPITSIVDQAISSIFVKPTNTTYISIDFLTGESSLLEVNKKMYMRIDSILR